MTFDQLALAGIISVMAAAATTAITVYASRKFGLPGVARQLTSEQAELIDTFEGRSKNSSGGTRAWRSASVLRPA